MCVELFRLSAPSLLNSMICQSCYQSAKHVMTAAEQTLLDKFGIHSKYFLLFGPLKKRNSVMGGSRKFRKGSVGPDHFFLVINVFRSETVRTPLGKQFSVPVFLKEPIVTCDLKGGPCLPLYPTMSASVKLFLPSLKYRSKYPPPPSSSSLAAIRRDAYETT